MISRDEVRELAETFWAFVRSGADGREAEHMFLNPGILIPSGEWMPLEAHQAMHRTLCDEVHVWNDDLVLTPLSDAPERVLAVFSVHWEASHADGRPGRIDSEISERWVIERGDDGALRWVLYWSDGFKGNPGSASLDALA